MTLKKLPMKLRLYIYILLGTDFLFLFLSLREKFLNFFSHLIFSALYPVFYGHIEKSIPNKKSAFDWSFYWYLTIVSQMIYWFFEIFWSVKNQLLRNRLLKFFFSFTPVMPFIIVRLRWNFHTWLCKPCWLTGDIDKASGHPFSVLRKYYSLVCEGVKRRHLSHCRQILSIFSRLVFFILLLLFKSSWMWKNVVVNQSSKRATSL